MTPQEAFRLIIDHVVNDIEHDDECPGENDSLACEPGCEVYEAEQALRILDPDRAWKDGK